jgi:hypothetical protein
VALLSLALKLVVGALPMREFSAMRPAFRDPDAIGALADEIFVQPGDALDCARKIRSPRLRRFSCLVSLCCLVS